MTSESVIPPEEEMFNFELLPHEMQLEVLKRTEFRTVQSMKRVSKRVKKFIQIYRRYMMPMPIRQMLITPDAVNFTLRNSCEVCVISHEESKFFLQSATVDLLWLEACSSTMEPIDFLQSVLPANLHVKCLKLGSSRSECDVAKLEKFMGSTGCSDLIIDWRFCLPERFFERFPIEKLSGLTIGEERARQSYQPLSGENLKKFRGNWLEIGPNRLEPNDFIELIQSWKSGKVDQVSQFNISINFPMALLAEKLRNCTKQQTPTHWNVSRNEETMLEIIYYPVTNFIKNPSVVFRQIEMAEIDSRL